ncbi:oxidoreductase [Gordonia sp. zg691]|uniref:Oxidoreductase n=1 Tax=Gordonia jinghuaiqii TaxID=2758710 RepID=A0A7D7QGN7_9ACTN|nr:MDR family oxidoreductase [Gordonia jinghuaiqii]MBD0862934.1 oxidoreductase [Gordonia jinghuaiqii]MCR5978941.1 acryloyl-CoA reductase [Gordonia jinghuaiqii]QMT01722.1 oxidoreductase [Gordonia jinghuaiqii]
MSFKALVAERADDRIVTALKDLDEQDLMPGEVSIDVEYSTVNFKDAMAITGLAEVIETFPLVPGIDLSGTVSATDREDLGVGDRVVVNGWGLSMTHHGGFAQRARVPGEWAIRLPDTISTRDAMAIGTAGYTAMLSVLALERGGVTPDCGEIVVTGANGGVGSIAIALLSDLGYDVIASTGRPEEADYLRSLGASAIIDRATLSDASEPLAEERWAGAVDSVGSHTLANVLAHTKMRGVVAACGLAQGTDLPGSVLPFILRGVTLAGIDSVHAPVAIREEAWSRLATDLDLAKLAATARVVGLADVPEVAADLLAGQIRGRTVVDVQDV